MTRNSAEAMARRYRMFTALALVMGLGLAGCGSIDNALFGSSAPAAPETPASATPGTMPGGGEQASTEQPGEQQTADTGGAMPGTLPSVTTTTTSTESMSGPAATSNITPVAIASGADTGTAVSHTIQGIRGELSSLQDKIVQASQRLAELRNAAATAAGNYHGAKAQITTRLEMGTTRGNPELVAQWNGAQSSLDVLTVNINALNSVGGEIATDASQAHFALDTIQSTFNVSGAVDEDHRQLSALQDEAGQTIVLIDRLLTEVSADVQRQTAYVANERANLTTLASAIKNGEFYGTELGTPMMASVGGPVNYGTPTGAALVTIRFDHPNVAYQQILYSALAQALQSRPTSSFAVVAVSPTRGSAAAVQLAQTEAQKHAQDVMRSMTDMGVPAARLAISSSTDPTAASSEVRVYVR
jgi:hypothetical protein